MTSHLTRNERERCVMARVQRQRVRRQQNFSFKKYGSWEAAREADRTLSPADRAAWLARKHPAQPI